jgi:hypothetical protein
MFGKQKPLTPRPENEPKFNTDNQSDRALLRTLVLLMGIVLILLVAGVAVYLFFF